MIISPYLLFFSLGQNDEVLEIVKKEAKLHGLALVEVYGMAEIVKNVKALQYLSPNEFIAMFEGASYVVSTSFHGTVFSIIFHKPFICVDHSFGKSRFHSLLEMLGLQDRLVDMSSQERMEFTSIDWNSVDEILFQKRKEAILFIERALN